MFYILLYKSAPIFDNAYRCTWVRIYAHHPHERHGSAPTARPSRIKIAGCVLNVWHYKFKRKLSLTTQTNKQQKTEGSFFENQSRARSSFVFWHQCLGENQSKWLIKSINWIVGGWKWKMKWKMFLSFFGNYAIVFFSSENFHFLSIINQRWKGSWLISGSKGIKLTKGGKTNNKKIESLCSSYRLMKTFSCYWSYPFLDICETSCLPSPPSTSSSFWSLFLPSHVIYIFFSNTCKLFDLATLAWVG